MAASKLAWRQNNPDKLKSNAPSIRAARKRWRERNPHWHRDHERRKKLGVTREEMDTLLLAQSGKCAICQDDMVKPCLDHDHETNAVRELLCSSCNIGIGCLKDDPVVVEAALRYLQKHKES